MSYADEFPSYRELLDTIADQKVDIVRLTRDRDEWKAAEKSSYDEVVRLGMERRRLEGELRRLRDLVNEDDVAIIDEVLDAS